MNPAASSMSPASARSSSRSAAALSVQRAFSPPRPPMSLPARSSLARQSSYSACRLAFLAFAAASAAARPSSLSTTSFSAACFTASSAMTTCRAAPWLW